MTNAQEISKMIDEAICNIRCYEERNGKVGSGVAKVRPLPMMLPKRVTDTDRIGYISRQLKRVVDAIGSVGDLSSESVAFDNTADADCAGI